MIFEKKFWNFFHDIFGFWSFRNMNFIENLFGMKTTRESMSNDFFKADSSQTYSISKIMKSKEYFLSQFTLQTASPNDSDYQHSHSFDFSNQHQWNF